MRVALAQLASSTDKAENLRKVLEFMRAASRLGAELVVFPEYTNLYAERELGRARIYELSESEDSELIKTVKREASSLNINLVIGVYEKGERPGVVYSSAFVVSRSGEVLAKYRKSHIYEALGFSEAEIISASSDIAPVVNLDGTRLGVMICYEVRFPEIARSLTLRGAEAILVPAAWYRGPNKEDQWITLIKARALENTVYMATANQLAGPFVGPAALVDPLGVMISRGTEEEGLIVGEIDKDRLKKARESLPVLRQRRPELYIGLEQKWNA